MLKKESRQVVNLVLRDSDIAKLTELKKSSGFSKSELVRIAINELYTKHSNQKPNEQNQRVI